MSQRTRYAALFLVLLSLAPFAAQAKVFKCVAANGELTFSQTPCPNDKSKVTEQSTEVPPDADEADGADQIGEDVENLYASAISRPVSLQDNPSKQELDPVQLARMHDADARDEEQRLQCRQNVKAQIASINSQLRAGYSSSQDDSLKKKRRDFENRLDEC
jgi:hypothetical protein